MKMTKLVFVPSPGIGHMVSTVEFSKRLIERDDQLSIVVLVISLPVAPNLESYSQQVAASNTNIQFINIPQADPPPPEFLISPENYFSVFLESHKSHVKNAIIDQVLLSESSSSLAGLVVDLFCSSMIDVANELCVPSYVFFTSNAAFLGFMLYLPIHYNQYEKEFETSDSIIPAYDQPVPSGVIPSFAFNKDGGYASFLKHATRFKQTKGIIVNTFAEFEPHPVNQLKFDSETPPIYTVGPLLDLKGQKQLESDRKKIMKWLDDQPPSSVVFLCFGSLGSFAPDQLAEMAMGIEQSGYRFLWSVRSPGSKDFTEGTGDYSDFSGVLPEGFLERIENRGFVCGWAPQVEVLAHEAVGGFVSHCGWNSILESLWHGVPIATWPLYAEQQINAFQLVRELELAVELTLDYRMESANNLLMAEEIEKAIRCLMDTENPVRKRVKEMKEMSRKAIQIGGSSFMSLGRLIEDMYNNKAKE